MGPGGLESGIDGDEVRIAGVQGRGGRAVPADLGVNSATLRNWIRITEITTAHARLTAHAAI